MKIQENYYGGVDIYSEKDKFLLHLNDEDIEKIRDIQQHKKAVDMIKGRLSTWVEKQIEEDWEFADFNSHLFSNDEISAEAISQKILDNTGLVDRIISEYQDILNSPLTAQGLQAWAYADEAIGAHVSIKDVMGEILCEKHPKELCLGKWRVAVVEQGETYGTGGGVVHDNARPVIEFYDMSLDKNRFPNGQFTSGRYYLETLMSSDNGVSLSDMADRGGLELCGGVKAWVVSPGELNVIGAWLTAVKNHIEFEKEKGVNVIYRGEVDVPHDFVGLAKYKDFDTVLGASEEMLRERLSAIPEFSSVSVEHFGNYIGGYGFSFSFFSTVDEITTQALLKHTLTDLKYEVCRGGNHNTLENTLNDAQERSRQQCDDMVSDKEDKEFGE